MRSREENRLQALDLLRQLLEIPSVNSDQNEAVIAGYIRQYFEAHGVEASLQEVDGKRANVIAWIPGKHPEHTMIWNGHLDTVPYGNPEKWDSDPAKVSEHDRRWYARGASDMKSGLAAMVYTLANAEEPPEYNIQFLGTCDEERSGCGAEKIIEENKMKMSDLILIGEPTGLKLGTAQKGCLWLKLELKGRTSHGAYPQEGVSAIHHGMQIADEIRQYVERFGHAVLGNATAQVTMIEGGVVPNMTADTCSLVMDIRLVPGIAGQEIVAFAEDCVNRHARQTGSLKAELQVLNDRRAIEIPDENELVREVRRLVMEKGYSGKNTGINYFTDGSVLDRSGEKNILLFGPGEPSMAHKPNEYVELDKYEACIEILTELLRYKF